MDDESHRFTSDVLMATEVRTTDQKTRISLPKGFANSTVILEQVSETEVRIRKAKVLPEDELHFYEENRLPLSDGDRDIFLALLDNPPPPTKALRRAASMPILLRMRPRTSKRAPRFSPAPSLKPAAG
jgi:hypothetical protein